jgi:glutamate synthase (ferredoxin)
VPQDHGLEKTLDGTTLLELARPALDERKPVRATLPIRNTNRVVGTMTGSELTRRYGPQGLPDDTIHFHFKGSAGQSFGAFIPRGMTLVLEGDSNDYIGKGLSGGRIVVFPPAEAALKPEENIIIGNVAFYGATAGEAFIRGVAGERFCVRNSGAMAVVEGAGDHFCEYMTGGVAVALGAVGWNAGAGMTGGVAYLTDWRQLNADSVVAREVPKEDEAELRALIEEHHRRTGSVRAASMLANWASAVAHFRQVVPVARLQTQAAQDAAAQSQESAPKTAA